jgi:hypothetical protein
MKRKHIVCQGISKSVGRISENQGIRNREQTTVFTAEDAESRKQIEITRVHEINTRTTEKI